MSAPVTVVADPADCSFQFDPIGKTKFDEHGCDVAKSFLARGGRVLRQCRGSAPASQAIGPDRRCDGPGR